MINPTRYGFSRAAVIITSAVVASGCAYDVDDDFGSGGKTVAIAEDCAEDGCDLPLLDPMGTVAPTTIATPCTQPSDCPTGFCVDGVCCDSACTGLCKACTNLKKRGGSDGICGYILSGYDPDDECPGVCNGVGGCAKTDIVLDVGNPCTSGADCASSYCVDRVCCNSACNDSCKACNVTGSLGTCTNVALGGRDSLCNGVCDGNGTCLKATGLSCLSASECASGYCVDGICCGSACTDTCKACNVTGNLGTCTNVGAGQQDSTCNTTCNGNGTCLKAAGDSCLSGRECESRVCLYGQCNGNQPNPGRLQWLTSMTGYLHQLAAFNNGQGAAVTYWYGLGDWIGSFDANGQQNLGQTVGPYAPTNECVATYLARGGVFAWYVLSDHQCPHFPQDPSGCTWLCYTGGPSGASRPVAYLGGRNDVGQFASISGSWTDSGDYCSYYYGQRSRWTSLQRPYVTGMPGVTIPVPTDLQPPVILGPLGEFHWGSGTNLTKTDVNGVVSWTKVPSISGSVQSSEWDVDAAGNILIALSFSGSINYGAGPLVATSAGNLGLVKLDPAGNVLWQKKFAPSNCGNVKVTRTGTGDFTVSGRLLGMTDFGTGALSGQRFIVKFDSNGNALWHVDVVSAQNPLEVAGDLSGAVYVGANSSAAVNLGWGVLGNFVAKYE